MLSLIAEGRSMCRWPTQERSSSLSVSQAWAIISVEAVHSVGTNADGKGWLHSTIEGQLGTTERTIEDSLGTPAELGDCSREDFRADRSELGFVVLPAERLGAHRCPDKGPTAIRDVSDGDVGGWTVGGIWVQSWNATSRVSHPAWSSITSDTSC